jgi:hypothetical protein
MCLLIAAVPLQARRFWWPLLKTQWPSTLALCLYHCADTKPASLRVPAIFVLPWQLSASRECGSRLTLRLQHPIFSTLQFRTILLPVGSTDGSVGIVTTDWTPEELDSIPGRGKTTVLEKPPHRLWGPPSLFNEKWRCTSTSPNAFMLYAYCWMHQAVHNTVLYVPSSSIHRVDMPVSKTHMQVKVQSVLRSSLHLNKF